MDRHNVIETGAPKSPAPFKNNHSLLCDVDEASPHLRQPNTSSQRIMLDVLIALTPAVLGSIFFFGPVVLPYYMVSVLTSLGLTSAVQYFRKKPFFVDMSAAVTGLLFAMSMPASVPIWFMVAGPAFGLLVGRELFGGLGRNFLNPALTGRALLRIVFADQVLQNPWPNPPFGIISPVDAVARSTTLAQVRDGLAPTASQLWNAFVGNVGGKMGETSALLLLLGAGYLVGRRVIRMRIPMATLATMAVIAFIFAGPNGLFTGGPTIILGHLLGGATMLGVFFMATDYGSTPSAPAAQWIFGVLLAVNIMLWRLLSPWAEGFTFALLTMNLTVPLFNRFIRPRVPGESRKESDSKMLLT